MLQGVGRRISGKEKAAWWDVQRRKAVICHLDSVMLNAEIPSYDNLNHQKTAIRFIPTL